MYGDLQIPTSMNLSMSVSMEPREKKSEEEKGNPRADQEAKSKQ